jgi:hypothetical protein
MAPYITVQKEITRHYRRFNAERRQLTVRMTAPRLARAAAQDHARHFANSVDHDVKCKKWLGH